MLEKATNKPDTYRPDLEGGGMLRSTTQEQRIQQKRKKEKERE